MKNFWNKHIKKIKITFKTTVIVSLFIHLFVFSLQIDFKKHFPQSKEKRIQIVLSSKTIKKVLSEEKKQIVNNELTGRKERPKDSKFLGKENQTYDRETKARIVDKFKEAGKGQKNGVMAQPVVASDAGKEGGKNKKKSNKISLADLGVSKESKAEQGRKKRPTLASLGLQNGKSSTPGLAQNNDFIEELPLGDMTNLNTVEFKYYGFYHRIRQKLEQFWGNSLREKADILSKKGRRMPASENMVTGLVVTLDKMGNIVEVKVKNTSGIMELDQAAIESFTKAGPFPNPPQGMLKNGFATIEWGFVVKS